MPDSLIAGGGLSPVPDPWLPLLPVMAAHGVTLSPPEFFTAVNRVWHACCARSYDELNRHLRRSLPDQFQALVSDFLRQYPPPNHKMSALDIGCGTGISSELLLDTRLGAFIRQIDLVDPSQEMLDVCTARRSLLKIRRRMLCSRIEDLSARVRYDVVVAGGVLQHVADLPEFLRELALRQPSGGIFLHLQDPNGDYLEDPERLQRVEKFARSRHGLMKRLSSSIRGRRGVALGHVREINQELLRRKIVATRLTGAEIAKVVGMRSRDGRGISIRLLASLLPDYRLVALVSYAFFGELYSALPPSYRPKECALIEARALNGCQVGAIWMKGK